MSNLPKIDQPIYNIKLPSTKESFKFRPFLVKEEKLLLMAKESNNLSDILTAIKQIVGNCSLEKKFNANKIALFELEYVFLKLRSFSVNNIVKVSYRDNEDEKAYNFEVDLEKVEIKYPDEVNNIIKITEKSGIIMMHPPATLYDDQDFLNLEKEYLFELIIRCIDKIYDGEEVYEAKDYKKEDLSEFLENLSIKTFEEIQKFLINTPKLEYVIKYKNGLDNDREINLSSLNDFFTWQ
jgi:hypothetical protein